MLNIDYYDKVLGGMALSLVSGVSLGVFTNISVQLAVGAGAAVSIAIMYHGIFRNGPVG